MLKNRRFQFVVVLLMFVLNSGAEEPNVLKTLDEMIPVKTSGGFLFWSDVLFDDSWRIQENIKTHSFRLLDGNFVQRSFGTFEECQNRLNEIKIEKGILPMSGTAVIILHGFGSNVLALQHFGDYLREKNSHDYVFCMSYPSTMQPILEHARMLRRVVEHLPATIRRIDFVGHSLGSIVIRRYLSGPLDDNWTVPDNPAEYRKTFSPDKRIGRFVMIGPPNHGAEIARKIIGNDPVKRFFAGKSGDELGIHWDKTEKTLGIPCCEFMIISGGRGDSWGYSTMIAGDDDGMVSTEGTKLDGASEWTQFRVRHNEMLLSPDIFEKVRRFLEKNDAPTGIKKMKKMFSNLSGFPMENEIKYGIIVECRRLFRRIVHFTA